MKTYRVELVYGNRHGYGSITKREVKANTVAEAVAQFPEDGIFVPIRVWQEVTPYKMKIAQLKRRGRL